MNNDLQIKKNFSQEQSNNDLLKLFVAGSIIALAFTPPFIKVLKEVGKAIQSVIKTVTEAFLEYIDEFLLQSELLRNYWIIMDKNLQELLVNSKKRNIEEIEQLILNYYQQSNFSNLERLFENYRTQKVFDDRLPIIDSCIKILANNPIGHSSTVVIPTLLSQITGIYDALLNLIPEKQKAEIKQQIKKNNKKIICPLSANGKKPAECNFVIQGNQKLNKDVLDQYIMSTVSTDIYYNYKKIITNTFKNGKQVDKLQEDIKQKSVFRHKILHGTDFKYNSAKNVIKCFMELAFLMKLYVLFLEKKTKYDQALT